MYGNNYQQHSFSNVKSKEYQSSTNRDNSNLSKSNKHSILQMEQTSDKGIIHTIKLKYECVAKFVFS